MAKHISKLVICCFILLFFNCKQQVYIHHSIEDYTNLKLNKDSTFEYRIYNTMSGNDTFEGVWHKKEDTISINVSNKKLFYSNIHNYSVIEDYIDNSDSIIFDIIVPNDDTFKFADLYFSEYPCCYTTNGIIKIGKRDIDTFLIEYAMTSSIEYKVKNKNSNYFKITMYYQEIPEDICGNCFELDTIFIKKRFKLIQRGAIYRRNFFIK